MTCIVGLNTGKKIIIAGDGMGSDGFTYGQDKRPKVFKRDDFIFGVCGSYRVMQLLEHKFVVPARKIGQTTENFIYTTFVENVFSCLDNNNALSLKDGAKEFSGSFLFGYEKELYHMFCNFQINVSVRNFDAAGSGNFHAMASLYSTEGLNISPEDRLKKAIECANEFVVSVDNKVDMVELVYEEKNKPKPNKEDVKGIQKKGISK